MATNITARLSSLRKEKGLSQKDSESRRRCSHTTKTAYANAGSIFSAARRITTMSPRTTCWG